MNDAQPNVFLAIWVSFRAMPMWVQIWMVVWLVPVNAASIFFIYEPYGILIAFLAIIAMLLNVPIMLIERRMSKTMSLPHLPFWTPLVLLILWMYPDLSTTYGAYLWVLAATNIVSLAFDFVDAYKWASGDRG
ncbi:MAG: hypothetical protein ABJN34_12315 [Litoreibacter sp.]|uniref:hypothetical protein n=1 Tax=Litoreibacter sp. TaxID=1969459 RepID=UPI0032985189